MSFILDEVQCYKEQRIDETEAMHEQPLDGIRDKWTETINPHHFQHLLKELCVIIRNIDKPVDEIFWY